MEKKTHKFETKNNRKAHNQVNIFGIRIVSIQKDELLRQVEKNLDEKHKFLLLTPNPEILLISKKIKKYRNVLKSAEILVPDGVGIRLASNYLKDKSSIDLILIREVVEVLKMLKHFLLLLLIDKNDPDFPILKGRELFLDLIELCAKNNCKVYLVGGTKNVALKAAKNLKEKHKGLKIKFDEGPMLNEGGKPKTPVDREKERSVIEKINKYEPDFVFAALGSPKQEFWISDNFKRINSKGIMGVGGTFDYVAGKTALPPKLFSKYGLEWFWRLITQPKRYKRIFNAVIVFPFELVKYKLQQRTLPEFWTE